MVKMKFVIINGPNLAYLGRREPELYGTESLECLPERLRDVLGVSAQGMEFDFFQSNHEGAIIDRLERAWKEKTDGLVLNAGAYTHTSLALADCLRWIQIPCVEVHLTNIYGRINTLRHTSLIAPACVGVIAGFGIMGYVLAVQALIHQLTLEDT